uniref:Uncharacterized protein n=1 Tax=Caenorhabditis japonica TaxID=281687 RepID=A0A8R1ELL0_CAEJA
MDTSHTGMTSVRIALSSPKGTLKVDLLCSGEPSRPRSGVCNLLDEHFGLSRSPAGPSTLIPPSFQSSSVHFPAG